jgi:pimeloyl-ACP methyl ester carboxylesterase
MQSTTVVNTGITIAYETFGSPEGRPLLLVMGLGAQMIAWHPELWAALAAEDFFVVRFDNRDVGLSTHLLCEGMCGIRCRHTGISGQTTSM